MTGNLAAHSLVAFLAPMPYALRPHLTMCFHYNNIPRDCITFQGNLVAHSKILLHAPYILHTCETASPHTFPDQMKQASLGRAKKNKIT